MDLIEKNIMFSCPDGTNIIKFDGDEIDPKHGLSHCMKAVDFIIEEEKQLIYIEIKDPEQTDSNADIDYYKSRKIIPNLYKKYRDSFLYNYGLNRTNKPIIYCALICIDSLTGSELIFLTDELKRSIPYKGPENCRWINELVQDCHVFNIDAWNKKFSHFPVKRISQQGNN